MTDELREDGHPYVTQPTMFKPCEWCAETIMVRPVGRRPKFCGPRCRNDSRRAQIALDRAYERMLEAGSRAAEGRTKKKSC